MNDQLQNTLRMLIQSDWQSNPANNNKATFTTSTIGAVAMACHDRAIRRGLVVINLSATHLRRQTPIGLTFREITGDFGNPIWAYCSCSQTTFGLE